jgi:hypothetical protein
MYYYYLIIINKQVLKIIILFQQISLKIIFSTNNLFIKLFMPRIKDSIYVEVEGFIQK